MLAALLALPGRLSAQAEGPLALGEALRLARENSPELQWISGRRSQRVGEASTPLWGNPLVEVREENIDPALISDRFVTLSLPLDLTFRRTAQRASARRVDDAAVADSIAASRDLDASVATAFFRAYLAWEQVANAEAAAAAIDELARFESIRLSEGATAEGVAIRTQLEADAAHLELARSRARAEQAQGTLARSIGLPVASVGRPAVPEGMAPPEGAALPDLERAIATALATRPEYLAAESALEAAQLRRSAARRGFFGEMELQVGAKQTAGATGAIIALATPVPLFDRNGPARQTASGEVEMAAAELRRTENAIRAEVVAAIEGYRHLLDARLTAAPIAERGTDVAGIADAAYREGAITLTELLDAQRVAASARSLEVTWAAEIAIARIELNRSLGAPIQEGL